MVTPPIARYRQVAEAIRQEIAAGDYEPGEQLPAESSLADRFKLSVPTIHRAVQLLAAQGLVDVRHGYGTFVRGPSDALQVAAEALHRHDEGLDPVGECPDPENHFRYTDRASAVLAAMRATQTRP